MGTVFITVIYTLLPTRSEATFREVKVSSRYIKDQLHYYLLHSLSKVTKSPKGDKLFSLLHFLGIIVDTNIA